MRYPFIDIKRVNAPYAEATGKALLDVAASGWYLRGAQTETFERELCESCSAKHAVAVSNGLDALRLIFRSLLLLGRLKPGDKVIAPANTYIASILPVTEMGLVPLLIEPNPDTMNLNWRLAETAASDEVKALLTVHLYGAPCWDAAVARRLSERGIIIIEDNAQSIGAQAAEPGLNDCTLTGNLGHAAAFSFYPTKNVGAFGDAGAVTTSDTTLAKAVRTLANYGSDTRYHNIYQGYNCRMDELQAAILRVRLADLPQISARRRRNAATYNECLNNASVLKPQIQPGSVWHQYVVRVKNRDSFRHYLADNGIGSDVHYATPPHRQPCYCGILTGEYPITDTLADSVVSLPIASVTPEEIAEICAIINAYVAE